MGRRASEPNLGSLVSLNEDVRLLTLTKNFLSVAISKTTRLVESVD